MKKIAFLFFIFSLGITFQSCNNGDDVPGDDVPANDNTYPPSVFTLDITPSFLKASINWTVPEGENNENLLYDIYLDGILLESGLETTSYELTTLAQATDYTAEVVAKNENGQTSETNNFTTLDTSDFSITIYQLTATSSSGYPLDFNYSYNSEGLCSVMGWDYSGSDNHNYEYNENGQIIEQRTNGLENFETVYLTYSNDEISTVELITLNDGSFTRIEYSTSITNPNTFIFYEREVDWNSGQSGGDILSEIVYEVNQTLDTQNRILTIQITRQDTNEEVNFEFEYNGSNMSRIIENGDTSNAIDIYYDDKNHWEKHIKSFKTGVSRPSLPVSASSLVYDYLKFMPHMINYTQQNNIIEVREGGNVLTSYHHDYNAFNYPIFRTRNGSDEQYVFNYSIE